MVEKVQSTENRLENLEVYFFCNFSAAQGGLFYSHKPYYIVRETDEKHVLIEDDNKKLAEVNKEWLISPLIYELIKHKLPVSPTYDLFMNNGII